MPAPMARPGLETTNTGTVYHVQDDGSKVIAPTRRADGTYRKPVRVRAGYTPVEENVYRGPEVQQRFAARQGPPGYVPDEKPAPQNGAHRHNGGSPAKQTAEPRKPKPEAKPEAPGTPDRPSGVNTPRDQHASSDQGKTGGKPENRLRNLKKKLTEIATLEDRIKKEGEGCLGLDLQAKLDRKAEMLAEVAKIERQLTGFPDEETTAPAPVAAAPTPVSPPRDVPAAAAVAPEPAPPATEEELLKTFSGKPENRLRNLRKKLTEISMIEEKAKAEGLAALSAEMKQKVDRKDEIEAEVATIERLMKQLQT